MKYKCIVSYDGSSYNGYQRQKHDANTIQENIEKVLSFLFKENITIYGSGRTDKMVHAYGQVFHFEASNSIPCKNLLKACNEMLPPSIKLIKVNKANADFHARYSSHQKIYVYKIINSKKVDVFKNRYYTYISENLDFDLLNKAAALFKGTHDFINFTTNKKDEVESFIKEIYDVNVIKKKNVIEISFYGSGFLRYQVRMMVGAMLVVASSKKDLSFIARLLKDGVNERCSYKAPPQGLYLKKVIY